MRVRFLNQSQPLCPAASCDAARLRLHLALLCFLCLAWACAGAEMELIRDPHFQNGFHLLDPLPGKRTVYGELPGLNPGKPAWDLAQWSSRFPLSSGDADVSSRSAAYTNAAKAVRVMGKGSGTLSLSVNASVEYPRARKSLAEPWVHLLVQQDLEKAPALGDLRELLFRMDARLAHSHLASTNDYSPGLHAAQFLIYLTIANRNPNSPGYHECFWFGIPIYDNRHPIVPHYQAQDFGGTKLFIFTPSSAEFSKRSTHSGKWVAFKRDLLPLISRALEQARATGFIKGSSDLLDYQPMGIFIGWEVPGRFDVDLQMRKLSLRARSK